MKLKHEEKLNLHPRNIHRGRYDFEKLTAACPELGSFIQERNQSQTINFSDPDAVRLLNEALLLSEYGVKWDLPDGYLTPPIPGRADYIHYIADLLAESLQSEIPRGLQITGLDIGTGANMIYPILGNAIYGWSFVGTDIDAAAISNCVNIIEQNPQLAEAVSLQLQPNSRFMFRDVILPNDRFAFTICNPPFHASAEEAEKSSLRKITNLTGKTPTEATLNFGGNSNELWYKGGELAFVTQMIYESARFTSQCMWFTTLVSKASNLSALEKILQKVGAADTRIIDMAQGQKTSRILAWTFLTEAQQRSFNI